MRDERCGDVRDAIAELALGIASGDDRARALEHAARCPACQRMLDELAAVGDELLRLAPRREPPPGFEVGVLERIGIRRAARLGWRPLPAGDYRVIRRAARLGWRPLPAGDYRVTAVTRPGRRVDLGEQPLEAGDRTLSTTVDLDLREVAVLLLQGPRGAVYAARLPPPAG